MQDILNGNLPLTGDDAVDWTDNNATTVRTTRSAIRAPLAGHQLPRASGPCASRDTAYFEPLPDASIQHIRAALTGKLSPLLNGCFGLDYGDKKPIARGFVTVDTVTQCSPSFPNEPGYASGGVLDNRNILWGDYEVLDKTKKIARADALVHIRSGMSFPDNDPQVMTPGEYTFYSRFDAITGQSFRQPLATKFAAPYANRGKKDKLFPQGTSLTVWRDPKVSTAENSRAARGPRGFR